MEQETTNTVEAPSVLAGLQEGRIVNYVMADGAVRPLIVVNAWDRTGVVNGVLLFDGLNDRSNHPVALVADDSGFPPTVARWITSARYSESAEPGTWSWPKREQVVAVAVDPAVSQFMESEILAEVNAKLESTIATLNAKLDSALESVNGLIESHNRTIQALIADTATPAATPEPATASVVPAEAESTPTETAIATEPPATESAATGSEPEPETTKEPETAS